MATKITIFTDFNVEIDTLIKKFTIDVMQNIILNIAPVVIAGLTLYFMTLAIMIIMSKVESPLKEFVWQLFVKGIIVSVAFTGGLYQDKIADLIINFPEDLAKTAFSNSENISSVADNMLSLGLDKGNEIMKSISVTDLSLAIPKFFTAILIDVCTICLAGLGGGFFILIKMGCAIFVSIGAIFICSLLFKPVQQLFFKWLDQIIGYSIFSLILTVIFVSVLNYSKIYLSQIEKGDNMIMHAMVYLFIVIISIMFFFMAKNISMALSGMVNAGVASVISDKVANHVANKAKEGAKSAGNTARNGVKGVAKGAGYIAGRTAGKIQSWRE
jgi:type IV secretory pathway VirB6-like protein